MKTSFLKQYTDAKAQNPDALLLFRLGDFYELFGDDARTVARECELTLTSKDKGKENALPMCGVPYHAIERHTVTLLTRGFRVAICEEVVDPCAANGIVKRQVVRVLSPGTVLDAAFPANVPVKEPEPVAAEADFKAAQALAGAATLRRGEAKRAYDEAESEWLRLNIRKESAWRRLKAARGTP